jgi:hypothetical protein
MPPVLQLHTIVLQNYTNTLQYITNHLQYLTIVLQYIANTFGSCIAKIIQKKNEIAFDLIENLD